MKIPNPRLILIILTAFVSISTNAMSEDNMFRQVTFADENLTVKHELLFKHLDANTPDLARSIAIDLVNDVTNDTSVDGVTYAKVLTNAAVLDSVFGNYSAASASLDEAITLMEKPNQFNLNLFRVLMARGSVYASEHQPDEASYVLRRAQHIAHRSDGVYTALQIPIINMLASLFYEQGFDRRADIEQRFRLKISELNFGVNGEELLPTLTNLGAYFADRGNVISHIELAENRVYRDQLFRDSVELYERAISIIEDKYGKDNLRLIEPLKGLSIARFKQERRWRYHQNSGGHYSVGQQLHTKGKPGKLTQEPMERAMGIVVNHPASDDSDVARSYISLADTYVLTSNRRAKDLYLQAWEILSADPAHEELRYELFGRPKRLHPLKPIDMQIDHFPTGIEPGTKLFIDVEYAVYPNGRVRNIKVLETNISTAETKQFKYFVGEMRYRPRIIEGEIQTTEGLGMYQTFEVPNLQQAVSSTSSP